VSPVVGGPRENGERNPECFLDPVRQPLLFETCHRRLQAALRAQLGRDLAHLVREQAKDVEHRAEALALLLHDPHDGAQADAHLRQELRRDQLLQASKRSCATSSGERARRQLRMLTEVVPSTSHASATARSCEGRSTESSRAFASQSAVTGAPTADCARRWRGSCRSWWPPRNSEQTMCESGPPTEVVKARAPSSRKPWRDSASSR